MKITRKGKSLIVEIPTTQDAMDWEGNECGTISAIIGVQCGQEQGFFTLNDMTYAGKEPQIGTPIVVTYMDPSEFVALCDSLIIDYYEYPICRDCSNPIDGSFTLSDKGNQCFKCHDLKQKTPKSGGSADKESGRRKPDSFPF